MLFNWLFIIHSILRVTTEAYPYLSKDENNGTMDQELIVKLFKEKYGSERVLERSIRIMDGRYVDISDEVGKNANQSVIFRKIGVGDRLLTTAILKPPKNLSEDIDTSKWQIDKEALEFDSYATTMIEEMFISGAVEISKQTSAKLLLIGLGGGYISTYLHHNFPQMDITSIEVDPQMLEIAKKWFNLEQDEKHHVFITDGVEYAKRAATNGMTYDVILLDASADVPKSLFIAPVEVFVTADVAENFGKLLKEKGALIINILCAHKSYDRCVKELHRIYGTAFKYCTFKKIHNSSNLVKSY
ncbi:unnamed protein product [Cylicocyclus nassatus]|uniref:Uncharacterized protein n=1 Tax=Cylicocyclus nassatus TaxID=53992 RepID=A0AA36GXN0_CYLNA|nr:unnamed protein product [Cylicocyclus nassatus]